MSFSVVESSSGVISYISILVEADCRVDRPLAAGSVRHREGGKKERRNVAIY